jgi:hypothetical protein
MNLAMATIVASLTLSQSDLSVMNSAIEATCPPLKEEAVVIQMIRVERSNPAGVIDLRRLHELGEDLVAVRSVLNEARRTHTRGLALFRRWSGKQLDAGFCFAWGNREPVSGND